MKYFAGLILLIAFTAHGQSKYKVSYSDLLKYEGTYQYGNGGQLQIAANPKDTLLYAIIGESRYRLRPSAKDDSALLARRY